MPDRPVTTVPGLAALLPDHPADPRTPVLHRLTDAATLGELTAAVDDLAGRLVSLGVSGREPVACVVEDALTAVLAMFAVWRVGGVYIPVNARLADAELHEHLAAADPLLVVVDEEQAPRVPGDRTRLIRSPDGRWNSSPGTPWAGERFAPGTALIMRTSGTTGPAKPVVLRHAGILEGVDTVIARLRGGSRGGGGSPPPNLIPASLALWAGIWNVLFAFRVGAPVILLERFDPVHCAELIRRHGIRSTVLAPAMMTMLVEDPRVTDLAPLKLVRSITAPLTPAQARRFRERFGVGVLNSYGQTELGGEVVGWTAADLREFGDAKLGSPGRPHPGITLRVLDEEHAQVPPGEPGEIWIHSPFATRQDGDRVDGEGFLRTGDLGRVDADGFLWIEGRVSDMINRGGFKIVPQEVEDALRGHPDVADACVAGVPDPRLGEVPVAWVRPAAGAAPDEAALREFARGALAGYKVPVAIHLVPDFPRNEIGKVLRRELVAGYERTNAQ
ncbi:long-chain fatty acid--CoA ligase [Actinomadura craniellae]|uniref:Long-chain fatty acid--CoA ligase n=1 Tax=Actinomadura craniellae TaxID=2231787 RepID=A0A365HB89_9ACTN|nr:class I adenylate-forming enzyme family protein [Actinomadura craniellae]RAY16278.1 long-chain fatty acid--CoA ligase [Actinomadura craniellae]